ncbi:MAG: type II secretion system protein, partial [Verrucomicrobiota bacterium]
TPRLLICPSDSRVAATDFGRLANGNVSYFIGLNAQEQLPESFLTGDRNLTVNEKAIAGKTIVISTNDTLGWTRAMHQFRGNIALSDGSVQQFDRKRLGDFRARASQGEQKLAFP